MFLQLIQHSRGVSNYNLSQSQTNRRRLHPYDIHIWMFQLANAASNFSRLEALLGENARKASANTAITALASAAKAKPRRTNLPPQRRSLLPHLPQFPKKPKTPKADSKHKTNADCLCDRSSDQLISLRPREALMPEEESADFGCRSA